MARALDHLVIGVNDLDAAGARFAAMGFTVAAATAMPGAPRTASFNSRMPPFSS